MTEPPANVNVEAACGQKQPNLSLRASTSKLGHRHQSTAELQYVTAEVTLLNTEKARCSETFVPTYQTTWRPMVKGSNFKDKYKGI